VAVLQISELLTTTLGAEAVGGVLFVTTVDDTVFVSAAWAWFIRLLKKNIIIDDNTNPIIKGLII